MSINTVKCSDIRWLFNYQQTQTQLLLQLVEIFPCYTIGSAENLYFSFYFGIHSVPCNDQHKIFQITKGPLTAGEEHLYTSREPRPSCAKIKSLFDWDFKPFLDKAEAITPWLLSFLYRGNFGFLKHQLKSPTTLSLNCFITPVNCLVWVSARVKVPCYRAMNLQSTLKTSTLQVQSPAFFFF